MGKFSLIPTSQTAKSARAVIDAGTVDTEVTVVSVTGSGSLSSIMMDISNTAALRSVKVTIDGGTEQTLVNKTVTDRWAGSVESGRNFSQLVLNCKFSDSMVVKFNSDYDGAGCLVTYLLDN